ncbi:hypothetical protein ACQEVC_08480 [Plantactinospora sp. CA-294935]|uniref:hypothetical protein n=1 Tax=Plantactinospora sp. CA-294935 TaxID=3240012 RepID=UPI003D8D000A
MPTPAVWYNDPTGQRRRPAGAFGIRDAAPRRSRRTPPGDADTFGGFDACSESADAASAAIRAASALTG